MRLIFVEVNPSSSLPAVAQPSIFQFQEREKIPRNQQPPYESLSEVCFHPAQSINGMYSKSRNLAVAD